MLSSVMTITMAVAMQVNSGAEYSANVNYQGGGAYAAGASTGVAPQETDVTGGTYARTSMPAEWTAGYGEQLYRYDYQAPWHHYYFQEMPAYGGFNAFRPYNYKHLLAQSQAAGGWGLSPQMPYSQQYWHRYQQRALMQKMASTGVPTYTPALAQQPPTYAPNNVGNTYQPQPQLGQPQFGGAQVNPAQINPATFQRLPQPNGQYPVQQPR